MNSSFFLRYIIIMTGSPYGMTTPPTEAPTPDATSVASQLQSQLGRKATVTVTGSKVTVIPKYGLSEQHMSSLQVTMAATTVPPKLTGISFSIKDAQGNTVDLDDSALAAEAMYAYSLKQSASVAYTAALNRGDAYYTFTLPDPSVIDSITANFAGEDTVNKQKTATVFTMECDAGVVGDAGY
jgi:hypothetical protein